MDGLKGQDLTCPGAGLDRRRAVLSYVHLFPTALARDRTLIQTMSEDIFCVDCAELLFGASKTCPACASFSTPTPVI